MEKAAVNVRIKKKLEVNLMEPITGGKSEVRAEISPKEVVESLVNDPSHTEQVVRKLVSSSYWEKYDIQVKRVNPAGRERYPEAPVLTKEEELVPKALPIVAEIFVQQQPWADKFVEGRKREGKAADPNQLRASLNNVLEVLDSVSNL